MEDTNAPPRIQRKNIPRRFANGTYSQIQQNPSDSLIRNINNPFRNQIDFEEPKQTKINDYIPSSKVNDYNIPQLINNYNIPQTIDNYDHNRRDSLNRNENDRNEKYRHRRNNRKHKKQNSKRNHKKYYSSSSESDTKSESSSSEESNNNNIVDNKILMMKYVKLKGKYKTLEKTILLLNARINKLEEDNNYDSLSDCDCSKCNPPKIIPNTNQFPKNVNQHFSNYNNNNQVQQSQYYTSQQNSNNTYYPSGPEYSNYKNQFKPNQLQQSQLQQPQLQQNDYSLSDNDYSDNETEYQKQTRTDQLKISNENNQKELPKEKTKIIKEEIIKEQDIIKEQELIKEKENIENETNN